MVSGRAGGLRLKGPAIPGARPTTELVRGAIFNSLGSLEGTGAHVLDLFAGSGSLGIEALSRGAESADFVERNPRQCDHIRENLSHTGLADRATVYCMDADVALKTLEGPYHLVLMDPPYKLESVGEILSSLDSSDLLEPGARVVVGHSKRLVWGDRYVRLVRVSSRRHGDSVVEFLELPRNPDASLDP